MSSPGETNAPAVSAWHHLHPAMLWFEAGQILRRLLVPLIIGGVAVSRREGGMLAFVVVAAIISAFGFVSRYLSFRYRLTPDAIELRDGIFTRRQRRITVARISHIDTHQNAIARFIGVVRLDIETEGGGAPEASFAALSLSAAEEIRQHVGPVGAIPEREHVLYEASMRDRALAGATTLQLGGVIAMVFVAWRYVRRVTGGEGLEPNAPPPYLRDTMAFLDELLASISASPLLIALGIALLVLAIWGVGILVSIVRWHNFRITGHGDELQLQSGALSRSRTVIARERTQAVELRANALRYLLGLVQIAIVTAGSGRRERARTRVFIPITTLERAGDYLRALWPETDRSIDWRPVDPYYRRQYINRGLLTILVGALAVFFVLPLDVTSAAAIAGLSLGAAAFVWRAAAPSFRQTGFAIVDGYVHVRRGAIAPRRWIVAVSRIQAVILTQSLFQRRHAVMSLVIDVNGLAGNQRIVIPSIPGPQAQALQSELTPPALRPREAHGL